MIHRSILKCPRCENADIKKAGRRANNAQRYQCNCCGKIWQNKYEYKAYEPHASDEKMTELMMRNVGVRAVAEFLGIAKDTVLNRLKKTNRKSKSALQKRAVFRQC